MLSWGNTTNGNVGHAWANIALHSKELSAEHTPQELRVWLAHFCSYYSTLGFDQCKHEDQQVNFV